MFPSFFVQCLRRYGNLLHHSMRVCVCVLISEAVRLSNQPSRSLALASLSDPAATAAADWLSSAPARAGNPSGSPTPTLMLAAVLSGSFQLTKANLAGEKV